ncbi:MAG: tetratricopeptide repeat protein [Actinomycetota bacterium]|nr:tetratricopeptide repeat protein [Actinomycetota bacterium]
MGIQTADLLAGVNISLAGRVAIGPGGGRGDEAELGERARVALAYLVLERWRPVGRDELAEVVWGHELPPTWRPALRGIVHRVRVALGQAGMDGAEVLTTGLGGYELHLPPGTQVDVEVAVAALKYALAAAAAGHAREATVQARRAVEASRGEFLAGISGMWVERRQGELRELHVEALEALARAAAACHDGATAVWSAEEAIALQPLRESAYVGLMAAHAAAGNRAEALRAYSRCRHVLVEELGVGPSRETETAYVALLGHESSPEDDCAGNLHAGNLHAGNLPAPVTSFVGRDNEKAELRRLLGGARLVTLTGMGGAGKSRLGLEVAGSLLGDYADGVWLVELASVTDPTFVAEHVLSVLGRTEGSGSTPTDALIGHFQQGQVLLLLDNCEQVAAGCASLCDTLLRSCPGLRILATSREPLSASGETIWEVAPLATPGPEAQLTAESMLRYESVRLFVDRARTASPSFALEPVIAPTLDICRRLEGIPLAIELAAARTRQLAVPDIARRLGDRFGFLVGGPLTSPERHQTLRQALDWSYDGLAVREREVFDRLSVFSGSFTLEAAETVCCDGAAVWETVSRLVDKSLLMSDRSGRVTRFRLLETVRVYGQERLVSAGDEASARLAQLQWAAAVTESAEAGLDGPDQAQYLEVLDAEHASLRGALDWAASHQTDGLGLRTAASLWRYWEIRGFLSEGRSRLEALLAADSAPPALRAKALNSAGVLAQNQLDHAAARSFYQEALDIRRSLHDRLGVAAALNGLGNVAVGEGNPSAAQALFEENLATSREIGDPRMIAASLMNLGVVLQLQFITGQTGRLDAAVRVQALYEESLQHYRQLGDRRGVALALENLGAVAPYRGDYPAAQTFLEQSLALRRELRDKSGIAASTRFLGHLALRERKYSAARRMHEEALTIESELGNQLLMATDLASLADIAERQGDHVEARALQRQALCLFDEVGDDAEARRLRRALAGST